jgi:hypothetical protein
MSLNAIPNTLPFILARMVFLSVHATLLQMQHSCTELSHLPQVLYSTYIGSDQSTSPVLLIPDGVLDFHEKTD